IEVADVLVVEVQVDKLLEPAVVEEALRHAGVPRAEVVEDGLDRGAGRLDDGLAVGVLPHGCGNVNFDRHEVDSSIRSCGSLVLPSHKGHERRYPKMKREDAVDRDNNRNVIHCRTLVLQGESRHDQQNGVTKVDNKAEENR